MSNGEQAADASDLYSVRARARTGATELGLRERHKIDKLERISNATHLLFGRDGYEKTTLREIAREAGVALGTLSLYARDKRDLILLTFNKLIPPLLEQGRKNARAEGGLAENIVAFFEPFYHTYAGNVALYQIVLGQIYSGANSVHARENLAIRAELVEHLKDIILRAINHGEVDAGLDLHLVAMSFYYIYFAEVRAWLSRDAVVPREGLAELRQLCDLHVSGMLR